MDFDSVRSALRRRPFLVYVVRRIRMVRNSVWRRVDLRRPVPQRAQVVIAGMATMPSRETTFKRAFLSIIRQVDHLYVYLDGFDEVPGLLKDRIDVTAILSSSEPGLHANGKLLGLLRHPGRFAYVSVDDDMHYCATFTSTLLSGLHRQAVPSVVGLAGGNIALRESRPFIPHWYGSRLRVDQQVDVLATGAVVFNSEVLPVDVTKWPKLSMTDLGLALVAAKVGVPLVAVKRKWPLIIALAVDQEDSLSRARALGSGIQHRSQERLSRELTQTLGAQRT